MGSLAFRNVDEYLMGFPDQVRELLEEVRAAIRLSLPDAEELISYNLPVYKIQGKSVIYFAGWKKHYSIYPASEALVQAFGTELGECAVVKFTLQFSYKKRVPVELIKRIAEFRRAEVGFWLS